MVGGIVGWLVGWMHWSKVTQLVSDWAKYTNYKYSPLSIDLRPFWRGVGFDKYISAFPVFCFQKPFPLPGVHQKRTREGQKGALGNLSTARRAAQIRKYFSAAFSQRGEQWESCWVDCNYCRKLLGEEWQGQRQAKIKKKAAKGTRTKTKPKTQKGCFINHSYSFLAPKWKIILPIMLIFLGFAFTCFTPYYCNGNQEEK